MAATISLTDLYTYFQDSLSSLSLDLAGLILLADFPAAAKRTALCGTSSLADSLVLVPGLHKQATAPELSKGEYPACAAMTTGYVFRVENPATVYYLQNVGRSGHLTTLSVGSSEGHFLSNGESATLVYVWIPALTFSALNVLAKQDLCASFALILLMLIRLINSMIIRRRAKPGWFGAPEPDVHSSLLVLLSQDRWIRLEGPTDDVKAVTSGTWLSEPTALEKIFDAIAKVLLFFVIILIANATKFGQLVFIGLLLSSTALLCLVNSLTSSLSMNGRRLQVTAGPKKYDRRLTLAKELVTEFKRTDCFVGMGMIQPHQVEELSKSYAQTVIM